MITLKEIVIAYIRYSVMRDHCGYKSEETQKHLSDLVNLLMKDKEENNK